MKYKDANTITYDPPAWDDITSTLLEELQKDIKDESWYYPDNANKEYDSRQREYIAPIKQLQNPYQKYEYLIKWEVANKDVRSSKSPLYSLCYKTYQSERYTGNRSVHILTDQLFEVYMERCRESFIEVNLPVVLFDEKGESESRHYTNLKSTFDKYNDLHTEAENRFEEMVNSNFLFADLCLMIKYKLPDEKILAQKITDLYPEPSVDDFDDICERAKKEYRISFVMLNMPADVKGTMLEESAIIKWGALFDNDYDYLADDFCERLRSSIEEASE